MSGVYIFMASSASDKEGVRAKLDLMHEGKDIAYLSGEEDSCTCHAAVKVAAGERVWLRTFKPDVNGVDTLYHFSGGCMTSFSGVLVQPDL